MSVATHDILAGREAPRRATEGGVVGRLMTLWRRRAGERQSFAALDCRALHDLGISRYSVELELAKPFWRG